MSRRIAILAMLLCAAAGAATFPRLAVGVDTNNVLLAPTGTALFNANSNAVNAALPFQKNPISTNTPGGMTNVILGAVDAQTNALNTALTNLILAATNDLN